MQRIVFTTFGTKNFSQSLARLAASYRSYNLDFMPFAEDSNMFRHFLAEVPWASVTMRGAGYWAWKPRAILAALDTGADYVVYTDAAFTLINDPRPFIEAAGPAAVTVVGGRASEAQSKWCKRDAFIYLDADAAEYHNLQQLEASVIVCRNSSDSRAFLETWQDALSDPRLSTDRPNECGLPNLPDFVEHRHDQAILTILAKKAGLNVLPSPIAIGGIQGAPYGQVWHRHGQRDTHIAQRFWWWATGLYDTKWRIPRWAHPKMWGRPPIPRHRRP